jgi:hypothetical protein
VRDDWATAEVIDGLKKEAALALNEQWGLKIILDRWERDLEMLLQLEKRIQKNDIKKIIEEMKKWIDEMKASRRSRKVLHILFVIKGSGAVRGLTMSLESYNCVI